MVTWFPTAWFDSFSQETEAQFIRSSVANLIDRQSYSTHVYQKQGSIRLQNRWSNLEKSRCVVGITLDTELIICITTLCQMWCCTENRNTKTIPCISYLIGSTTHFYSVSLPSLVLVATATRKTTTATKRIRRSRRRRSCWEEGSTVCNIEKEIEYHDAEYHYQEWSDQ